MSLFNAEKFSVWLKEAYQNSKFKNYRALAAAAKSNPATISRLMNGTPQTVTDKPSQPKPELVERLANVLNEDLNQALLLAGYAPLESNISNDWLRDLEKLSPEDQKRARRQIRAIIDTYLEDEKYKDYDPAGIGELSEIEDPPVISLEELKKSYKSGKKH